MVRDLPWSAANEHLVEIFEITGQVELAGILFERMRSKVLRNFMYGGRPLDVHYDDRWHTFMPMAAKIVQAIPMHGDAA
ncbi:hypothetical protein EW146_g8253 [Bondarzewia mesenterica]|uniref:Uncharacterized protein n=1 Tax=Bondarzewia mesenterica TaxID=1095465 RepID=A0A4S4LHQ1_9AGAM|nr:hypothetical protein EW146_g8253 [Bondarzewia mesenterica]